MEYSIHLISNKPESLAPIQESISPETVYYFDGTDYPSFSKLVNDCIEASTTEINILMSDRVLPTKEHVDKVLRLLKMGYAFVGLYRFAFFGFKKELFRVLGPLDERFVGGGGEDDDYYFRLREADLAAYITAEVPYTPGPTRWSYNSPDRPSLQRLKAKWDLENWAVRTLPTRKLSEETTRIKLGPKSPVIFLNETQTYTNAKYASVYFPRNHKDLSTL